MSIDRERTTQRFPRRADFVLSSDDLRAVAAFTSAAAQVVLPQFEERCPDDDRPRQALDAALAFVHGDPRSTAQRVSAPSAHRAGKEATSDIALHAAMAAGDAAASVYLHPLADATQVKHILRGPAHAIRVVELLDIPNHDENTSRPVEDFAALATPQLIDVLCRYPRIGTGTKRTGPGFTRHTQLMFDLDERLRSQRIPGSAHP